MSDSPRTRVVYEAPSPHGPVFVVDEGDRRTLRLGSPDGTLQSAILKSNPLAVPISYVRVATAALALTPERSRALVVGLGGGAFPLLLHRRVPAMHLDVVELNPVVVDVAQRFFGVREDARLRLHVEDGASFMREPGTRYDLIFLDAFSAEGTPEHLKEALFLQDVRGRLTPGGVAVLNIALEDPCAVVTRIKTFARAFADCALLRGDSEFENLILVGTQAPVPTEPEFKTRLWQLSRELELPELGRSVKSYQRADVTR